MKAGDREVGTKAQSNTKTRESQVQRYGSVNKMFALQARGPEFRTHLKSVTTHTCNLNAEKETTGSLIPATLAKSVKDPVSEIKVEGKRGHPTLTYSLQLHPTMHIHVCPPTLFKK